MPKPVCAKCQLFYRPEKNGTAFIEGMPSGNTWVPYKLWLGDLWKCRGCGHEIIVGCPDGPLSEHFHPDFHATVERWDPQIQVNDC